MIDAMLSPSLQTKNYLFLSPVDTVSYPTYLNYVSHPMDLLTIKQNVDAGQSSIYANDMDLFDKHVNLCFKVSYCMRFVLVRREREFI